MSEGFIETAGQSDFKTPTGGIVGKTPARLGHGIEDANGRQTAYATYPRYEQHPRRARRHLSGPRLSSRDPQIGLFYSRIGCAHLLQSRTDEAILWCERARNATPAHPQFCTFLAAAHALKGDTERAAAELAEACRRVGDDRYSSIARLRALESWGVPKIRALAEATYFAGLRKAGMPER